MPERSGQKKASSSIQIPGSFEFVLRCVEDQYHSTLKEISDSSPTLLIFLRNFGCCFCREALSDIHYSLPNIEAAGVRLVLVHMSEEEEASQILASYGLADISRISNSDRSLYKSFGLGRGSLDKVLVPRVLARAIEAHLHGNLISKSSGDGLQLPGVFLLHKGRILTSFAPEDVDTRPDYIRIASQASLMLR
ncbi:MAG: redoxin domain-containing protein [Candidatus Obscuribacterales bacterium]|nr:redoxin domain-containing protein [Candidatus Obscuribacterales bacterium]